MTKPDSIRACLRALCIAAIVAASALGEKPDREFAHDGWVGGVAFDAKSSRLATASADETARLLDLQDGARIGEI